MRKISECAKKIGRREAKNKLLPLLSKVSLCGIGGIQSFSDNEVSQILKDKDKDVRGELAEQIGSLAAILSVLPDKVRIK